MIVPTTDTTSPLALAIRFKPTEQPAMDILWRRHGEPGIRILETTIPLIVRSGWSGVSTPSFHLTSANLSPDPPSRETYGNAFASVRLVSLDSVSSTSSLWVILTSTRPQKRRSDTSQALAHLYRFPHRSRSPPQKRYPQIVHTTTLVEAAGGSWTPVSRSTLQIGMSRHLW